MLSYNMMDFPLHYYYLLIIKYHLTNFNFGVIILRDYMILEPINSIIDINQILKLVHTKNFR